VVDDDVSQSVKAKEVPVCASNSSAMEPARTPGVARDLVLYSLRGWEDPVRFSCTESARVGREVRIYGIKSVDDMRSAIAKGAESVITDYPLGVKAAWRNACT